MTSPVKSRAQSRVLIEKKNKKHTQSKIFGRVSINEKINI